MTELSSNDKDFRTKVIGLLMGQNWPREEATMVVELSLHASKQAIDTLTRIANTATDDRMKSQVLVLAAQIMMENGERLMNFARTIIQLEDQDRMGENNG